MKHFYSTWGMFSSSLLFLLLLLPASSNSSSSSSSIVLPETTSSAEKDNDNHEVWRPDLPWIEELTSKLSPNAILKNTNPSNYLQECLPTFNTYWPNKTNHALIHQPSGLCLPHFLCAFYGCDYDHSYHPYNNNLNEEDDVLSSTTTTLSDRLEELSSITVDTLYSDLNSTVREWIENVNYSKYYYNLPSRVLFPIVASDVIAAVQFAKKYGLEISVKNSGHSFTASSMKKETLLLNMNQYTRYASTSLSDDSSSGTTITDCRNNDTNKTFNRTTRNDDFLRDQPCQLSLAKGKPAVIRVGGGENWDEIYRAVRAANEEQEDGYKYHIVGPAAGTVSPMGWTFQGGLAGNKGSRLFGFGVDQVLQIEMVLPNSHHVKFGPTEWDEDVAEKRVSPKTTSVSGLCRTNPEETDEESWTWEECPPSTNINFDDLWFAIRGGGGGTWGVVLSMHLQLHDYLSYERVQLFTDTCLMNISDIESYNQTLEYVEAKFLTYLLLDPQAINMTEDHSNACGWSPGDKAISCYGKGYGQNVAMKWISYVGSMNETLINQGIPASLIEASYSCPTVEYYKDLFEYQVAALSPRYPVDYPYADLVPDLIYPGLRVLLDDTPNIIIPRDWILNNIETAIQYFPLSFNQYAAFGGWSMEASSDQSNALSHAHRDAGYMLFSIPLKDITDDFYSQLFPSMYDTASNKTNFPGFIGSNHAGINTKGPLKEDWTKACPLDWTAAERNEKCIPLQEAIYGTELLKRLEAIKEEIDPDYIFDCNHCIGNNRIQLNESKKGEKMSTNSATHWFSPYFLSVMIPLALFTLV